MAFDILVNILIITNLIAIIIELALSASEYDNYSIYLKIINYVYFGLFVLEAIIKVFGHKNTSAFIQ